MTPYLISCGWMVGGLVLLIVGGELLVRGASAIAIAFRISPLVIGLTVVAFGTSAPELAVSIQSAFNGQADIAIGNVVGSNIANILLILGASALFAPLVVASQLVRFDVPLMIAAGFAMLLMSLDGKITRVDGVILVSALLIYTTWLIRQSRKESPLVKAEFEEATKREETQSKNRLALQLAQIAIGLVLLGFGSRSLVTGAVDIATLLGVNELIIGLTIVAFGTSLPELVTSIVASVRGQRDIAVGNVVGSNLFNILCVLGISSVVGPDGIAVSESALRFDIPVMLGVSIACLPIFFTGYSIARWEGAVFLAYYFAYTTYIVLAATQSSISRGFGTVMIVIVIPLTAITLAVCVIRAVRRPA